MTSSIPTLQIATGIGYIPYPSYYRQTQQLRSLSSPHRTHYSSSHISLLLCNGCIADHEYRQDSGREHSEQRSPKQHVDVILQFMIIPNLPYPRHVVANERRWILHSNTLTILTNDTLPIDVNSLRDITRYYWILPSIIPLFEFCHHRQVYASYKVTTE